METLLNYAMGLPDTLICIAAFGGMFIEGDVILLLLGILVHLGVLDPIFAFAAGFSGGYTSDFLWFSLGRHIQSKDHKMIRWIERMTKRPNIHIRAHPFKSLIITKFMYGVLGIHRAILIRFGMNLMPIKKFLSLNLISDLIWASALMITGYFASESIDRFGHIAKIIEFTVFGLFTAFIIIRKIILDRREETLDEVSIEE